MANFLGIKNPNEQQPAPKAQTSTTRVVAGPVPAKAPRGNYWIGQDGNVYVAETGVNGVRNYGQSSDLGARSFDALNGLTEIADPNRPAADTGAADDAAYNAWLAAQAAANAPKYEDTSGLRRDTEMQLGGLEGIMLGQEQGAQDEWQTLQNKYDAEDLKNETRFNERNTENESNLSNQTQAALLAAASGGRGLNSVLASIGALGGTGRTLANRAVANEANLDIGEAGRTFGANAKNLNTSYQDIKDQEKDREAEAELVRDNAKKTARNERYTNERSLYEKMADLWSRAGNKGQADTYLGKATDTLAQIGANAKPLNPGAYNKSALNYAAPDLQGYLAGANDMTVNTSAGSGLPLNGAIFTSTKKREKLA